MADTDIICHAGMGAGAPVYAPVPRWSETLSGNGTTTNTATSGDYLTVMAVSGAVRFYVAASGQWHSISEGAERSIGPMKDGDTITTVAIV